MCTIDFLYRYTALLFVLGARFATTKPMVQSKTDPSKKLLNPENRLRTYRVQLEFVDSHAYFDALMLQYL